jgi:uncharacterized protein
LVQPFITEKIDSVSDLCHRHSVRQLDLFGSSTTEFFDPENSDLDFLVEFKELTPTKHADAFFGLMEDLSAIFRCPIDLVEKQTIDNPYLQQSIEQSRVNLYGGA